MKTLLVTLLLFIFSLQAQESKKLALVIGNAEYGENENGWLKNPVNDARLIASTLKDIGFDVLLYENLKNRDETSEAVRGFGKQLENYDISFIYYAGHGIQIDGLNYIIPTEAELRDEFDVSTRCMPVQDIMRWLGNKTDKEQVHILVLDACRDNPFERAWSRGVKGSGLAEIEDVSSGVLIAYSTRIGKTAADGKGINSIYTTSLAKHLSTEGITIESIFKRTKTEVENITNKNQQPVEVSYLTGEDIYLLKKDHSHSIENIDDLINKAKYIDALESISGLIKLDDSNSEFYYTRARIYNNMELSEKALINLSHAIELNSNQDKYYILRARIHSEYSNEYNKALIDFSSSIELNPENPDSYYYRTGIYEELKEYDRALNDYNKAIMLNPENPNYYYARAILYKKLGEFDIALDDYNKAIELDPEDLDYYYARALLYEELEEFDKALENYNKAIELDPEDSGSYYARAILYEEIDEFDIALDDYNKAIELDPEDSDYYYARAILYEEIDEFDIALDDYNKAIELDPEDLDYYYARALLYEELEEFDIALDDYNKAIELDPEDSDSYYTRALLYEELEEFDNALEDYNIAIKLEPNNPELYYTKAILYSIKLKEHNKSISTLDKGLRNVDEKYDLYYFKSLIYCEEGMFNDALINVNKCIELSPKDPATYYAQYLIHHYQSKKLRALSSLEKAISRKKYEDDGYYIPLLSGEIVELSDLHHLKAQIYESINEIELMCEELVKVCELTDCNEEKYILIKKRISQECK